MPNSNEERDFFDVGKLRFPGRFDPNLLQNIDDAGDGFPGLQKAIRNWVDAHYNPENWDEYHVATAAEFTTVLNEITNDNKSGIINITAAFQFNHTINAPNSGIIIQGKGTAFDMTVTTTSGLIVTNVMSLTIRDLSIDASSLIFGNCININETNGNRILIDNINITGNNVGYGVYIQSENVYVTRSKFEDLDRGIYFYQCFQGGAMFNWCEDCDDGGIYLELSGKHRIAFNFVNNCTGYGICDVSAFYGSTIIGNCVENAGSDGIYSHNSQFAVIEGNRVYNSGGHGIHAHYCTKCTITGNTIDQSTTNGIHSTSQAASIVGNTCCDNGGSGIINLATKTIIKSNVCNTNINGNYGIGNSGNYCIISGNNCHDNQGITACGIYNTGLQCILVGNHCYNNVYDGISNNNGTGCIFIGNICLSNDHYGLYNNASYCTISSNYLQSNNIAGIYVTSSAHSTIIGNNCYDNIIDTASNGGGLLVIGCSNCIIDGNRSSDNTNGGAGTGYGIFIDATSANCELGNNLCTGNDVNYSIADASNTIGSKRFIPFEKWVTDNETNVNVNEVYDSTKRQIVLDIDATGAAASIDIWCQFIIPSEFHEFPNLSNDLIISAIQDAGADIDATITINFYDDAGTDSDDDSVVGTSLTGAWADYDVAIDAGTFAKGDKVIVKITLSLPDADDAVRIAIPIIRYY